MAWNVLARLPIGSRVRPSIGGGPARRGCGFAPLLLAAALSGCETLERMDYFDRFFEPTAARPGVVAATEPRPELALPPPTPPGRQPGAVAAMEPRPNPQDPVAADWTVPTGAVAAMEPRPDPSESAAADWSLQKGSVVAMEPRPNPPAADSGAQMAAAPRGRAAEPRPDAAAPQAQEVDPEARTRLLVRQNQWLTRFWMELTPAQQSRVERQLRRGDVVLAAEAAEPAQAWDAMGLSDRAKLIFGNGRSPERLAPGDRRDGSTLARTS